MPTDPPFEFIILNDDTAEDRVKFFEIELTITRNALLYPFAVGRVTIIDDDGFSMFKYFLMHAAFKSAIMISRVFFL